MLTVGYATLSTGLTTADRVGTGSGLTSSSWNRIVNGVLELDTRTAPISSSGGNVGIGTASPTVPLHVIGTMRTENTGGNSFIQNKASSGGQYWDNLGIGLPSYFRTSNGGTVDTTAMTLLANGNVGIGTTNPGQTLDVAGRIQSSVAIGGASMETVYGNICGSGTIANGSTGGNNNLNSCAGNGKAMLTVCSATTVTYGNRQVFRAFIQAHGNTWNTYGTDLANYPTDGALSVTTAWGNCTFINNTGENVKWVIKQLPLTSFASIIGGY